MHIETEGWLLKRKVWTMGAGAAALLIAVYAFCGWETTLKMAFVLLLIAALFRLSRRVPARAFDKRSDVAIKETDVGLKQTGFCSVAANDEALDSLRLLADFLKNPGKYETMGARLPRGVLLYGPPGTGKTLLARALAGEANVPFHSMAGSDFVQMYAGVGASRVRELFKKAREAGKCVIFIDEIDAMGKCRGDQSSDERDQTLNALLSEMSGFAPTEHIVVIAATNRIDTLDPALTRPGRFDRKIEVPLPSRPARLEILRLHAKGKPMDERVNLESLAAQTVQFSGASLENLLNEAAIHAARRSAEKIEPQDVDCAYLREVAGSDRRPTARREELAQIALHEAGHAVASRLLQPSHRLLRLSILPSERGAGGYNLTVPAERALLSEKQLLDQIQVLLAGRAAELLLSGEDGATSGASNDLTRAAELCAAMVMDLGMGGERAVSLRALQKACPGASVDAAARCREMLEAQLGRVQTLLGKRAEMLAALTELLLKEETLNETQIDRFFTQFGA